MKHLLFCIDKYKFQLSVFLLLALQISAFGQRQKSYYINRDGEKCIKTNALCKRHVVKKDTCWEVTDRYLNGNLMMTGTFLDKALSSKTDTIRHYYINGQLSEEYVFTSGLKQGDYKSYYITGELKTTGHYNIGEPSGEWYWYDVEGIVDYHEENMNYYKSLRINTHPGYPGGSEAFKEYIDQIEYPAMAEHESIYGCTINLFKINQDGKISDVEVIIHGTTEMDTEMIKLLENMPRWQPATEFHTPVSQYFIFTFSYILDNQENKLNDKTIANAFFVSGNNDYKENKLESAEYKFRTAIKYYNFNARYYYHLAVCLHNLGKQKEAIAYFKITHTLDDTILPTEIKELCKI